MAAGAYLLLGTAGSGGSSTPPATPTLSQPVDKGDGTGATASVSGSTAGSTNTVYTAPFPAPGTKAVWTASATITGDGAVTLSLANGCYLAYCESVLGGLPSYPSDEVSFQTTGGSTYESVHYALLESVATKIQSMLGTSIIGPVADSVRVRKVPFNGDFSSVSPLPSDKKHALPAILVCPFDLEAFNALGGTNARDEIGYPVAVVFIQQNNNPNDVAAETGTDPFLRWREAIERTYTHLRGVTSNAGLKGYLNVTANGTAYTFHNCTTKPGSIFDWNRWQPSGQNLDFGWLLLNFIIWRPGGA